MNVIYLLPPKMDSAVQNIDVYDKIKELLLDEEKIVTCVSLAADTNISLNAAKTNLTNFVKDFRKKPEDLYVTYMLSGKLKNSNNGHGLAVYFIKEEDLNEKKTLFVDIYTELIYSIQKSKNIDFNIITLIDNSVMESSNHLEGLIVSKNCVKRNIQKKVIVQPSQSNKSEHESFFKKVDSNNIKNRPKTDSSQDSQDANSQEKQPKKKKAGGIANYFMKGSLPLNGNPQSSGSSVPLKLKNADASMTQGKYIDESSEKNVEKENVCCTNVKEEHKPELEYSQNNNSSNKKRKKSTKVNDVPNKKRKRIQEVCDSDSSDIFEDEKDEDIIEKSDEEPEPVQIIQPIITARSKKRKAVEHTYMDEEGFMVTETKYIFENVSEDEEKESVKTSIKAEPKVLSGKKNGINVENESKKSKTTGNKNKKAVTGVQTTLMSFFKKE